MYDLVVSSGSGGTSHAWQTVMQQYQLWLAWVPTILTNTPSPFIILELNILQSLQNESNFPLLNFSFNSIGILFCQYNLLRKTTQTVNICRKDHSHRTGLCCHLQMDTSLIAFLIPSDVSWTRTHHTCPCSSK